MLNLFVQLISTPFLLLSEEEEDPRGGGTRRKRREREIPTVILSLFGSF